MKMPSTIIRNLYPQYVLLAFQDVNITDLTHRIFFKISQQNDKTLFTKQIKIS